ncbi:MAG TPA: lipopolysaccharide assembly protein LapA domain-containing protein [Xanthobacteraceae bacterium]|nr:lipopolysaccharide assembly protein LapA domain-containing protein [Xanthobacteraceae bacterium]
MMRRFVVALILVPLAVLIVMFAVANRASIPISLDPFSAEAPALTVHAPLFLALLLALIVGVFAGGIGAWLKQSKWRRAARRLERELRLARADAEDAHRRLATAQAPPAPPPIPSVAYRRPPAA